MRRIVIMSGIGVVVLLILIGVGALVNSLNSPAYLDILVAPIDAKVTIDGTEYRNATYKMEPGEYTVKITRDGYSERTLDVMVNRGETSGLYVYLDPENGDFSEFEEERNSESLAALLRLYGYDEAGREMKEGAILTIDDTMANEFVNKVTIGTKMPIYTSVCGVPARRTNCNAVAVNYDYDDRCDNKLCLIIMGREPTLSGEALEAVKAEIKAAGRNFDDYRYIYSQNSRM